MLQRVPHTRLNYRCMLQLASTWGTEQSIHGFPQLCHFLGGARAGVSVYVTCLFVGIWRQGQIYIGEPTGGRGDGGGGGRGSSGEEGLLGRCTMCLDKKKTGVWFCPHHPPITCWKCMGGWNVMVVRGAVLAPTCGRKLK